MLNRKPATIIIAIAVLMISSYIIIIGSQTAVAKPLALTRHSGSRELMTTTTKSKSQDESCKDLYAGPDIWSKVYGHPRLINPKGWTQSTDCITVTGKVLTISKPGTRGADADGDYHFNILADTSTYSNSHNCENIPPPGKQCQELIVEIVCYDHSPTVMTLPDAQKSCKGYQNHIKGPNKDDAVTITGKWVEDYGVQGDHHYWNEIHPVTKLCIGQAKPMCYKQS
jgi:hypothetical protein